MSFSRFLPKKMVDTKTRGLCENGDENGKKNGKKRRANKFPCRLINTPTTMAESTAAPRP